MTGKDSKADLDARAAAGETVVPGGTGGKSLEAQQHLAEGMNPTPAICATYLSFEPHNVYTCF
jgi:hypothetical protein